MKLFSEIPASEIVGGGVEEAGRNAWTTLCLVTGSHSGERVCVCVA